MIFYWIISINNNCNPNITYVVRSKTTQKNYFYIEDENTGFKMKVKYRNNSDIKKLIKNFNNKNKKHTRNLNI